MEKEDAIEILEQMRTNIKSDIRWLALDLAIEALEGQETKKNVVNVIPEECMKILSDAVMEAIRSVDWITIGEKMSERPTGRWLDEKFVAFHLTCDHCGCHIRRQREEVFEGDYKYNFCPNCGAKMEES